MRDGAQVKTREWKVYFETTYEQGERAAPRVGDPLFVRGTGGVPVLGHITEVSEEAGSIFVSFYEKR